MKVVSVLFLMLAVTLASAAGWVDIRGTNALGEDVSWVIDTVRDPSAESDNIHLDVWATVYVSTKDRLIDKFEKQPCYVDIDAHILKCDATGKSPLAGTKYVGKLVNGSCEEGDPNIRYRCTEGCEASLRAPTVMEEGYDEC